VYVSVECVRVCVSVSEGESKREREKDMEVAPSGSIISEMIDPLGYGGSLFLIDMEDLSLFLQASWSPAMKIWRSIWRSLHIFLSFSLALDVEVADVWRHGRRR